MVMVDASQVTKPCDITGSVLLSVSRKSREGTNSSLQAETVGGVYTQHLDTNTYRALNFTAPWQQRWNPQSNHKNLLKNKKMVDPGKGVRENIKWQSHTGASLTSVRMAWAETRFCSTKPGVFAKELTRFTLLQLHHHTRWAPPTQCTTQHKSTEHRALQDNPLSPQHFRSTNGRTPGVTTGQENRRGVIMHPF